MKPASFKTVTTKAISRVKKAAAEGEGATDAGNGNGNGNGDGNGKGKGESRSLLRRMTDAPASSFMD